MNYKNQFSIMFLPEFKSNVKSMSGSQKTKDMQHENGKIVLIKPELCHP